MKTRTDEEFRAWMKNVDAVLDSLCGLSHDDLPDICCRDMFEAGDSSRAAARAAIRRAKDEE